MTLLSYSKPRLDNDPGSLTVYADAACTVPLQITVNGSAAPDGLLQPNPDGSWPVFQTSASPVYVLSSDNTPTMLTPELSYSAPGAVTGAKAGNAALASLIGALIAIGVPLTDQTTA